MAYTLLNPKDKVSTQSGWKVVERVDGWVEVSREVTVTIASTAWVSLGQILEAKVSDAFTFPVTFTQRPYLQVLPYRVEGYSINGFEITANSNAHTVFPSIWVLRSTRPPNNTTVGVALIASGPVS